MPGRQELRELARGIVPRAFQLLIPMTKKLLSVAVLLLAVATSSAEGQRGRRPIELGIDGGVFFGLDDPKVTIVALPVQSFRIGFPITEKMTIEPRASINSIHGGGASFTAYNFEVGLVYSRSGDRVGSGLYGRPFVGISGVNTSGGGDDNDAHAGLGVGLRIPFADRRLATRMEANYAHRFSDPGSNQIGLLIGLSFFTR